MSNQGPGFNQAQKPHVKLMYAHIRWAPKVWFCVHVSVKLCVLTNDIVTYNLYLYTGRRVSDRLLM